MKKSEFLEKTLDCLESSVDSGSGICRALRSAYFHFCADGIREEAQQCWLEVTSEMDTHSMRVLAVDMFRAKIFRGDAYWWGTKSYLRPGDYKNRRAFLEHWINELKAKGE